ncbi:MAG: FKBP-type peptidyl-prolyl cis-trans isomerase [Acidimicrobiia bacterium]|nr:FKBP-type peptidyl-prolyl cis-trans isomerase [Acidimicrobiia bacterium]
MEETESGLFIQVLREGSGPPAGYGDEMGVHYTVWLPNGSKVDSSHDHNPPEPLDMVLGATSLIDGWVEGVTGMRMGERRKLVLPFHLAYGPAGRSGIPPYSPLVFEVELAEHIPTGEG